MFCFVECGVGFVDEVLTFCDAIDDVERSEELKERKKGRTVWRNGEVVFVLGWAPVNSLDDGIVGPQPVIGRPLFVNIVESTMDKVASITTSVAAKIMLN